ncbi:MAG: phosphoribosylformylglycinamidine cyclo-ligase [Euryarchaeota archaeon]|nr:phosphoribosylformylglycinamidine cyclo-ligase [Euryarchaeota archaeon]
MTYAGAGVDTARQKAAIRALAGAVKFQRKGIGAPLTGLSHFAGLIDFGDRALAICTDGVGTKLEVAKALRKWDTVGIDCIAMNVNDCICVGAEPIAFVDYIATSDPDPEVTEQIGVGLNEGAKQANVTLAGGETAVLPELVNGWDLAGSCVGFVSKSRILGGSQVRPGDVIIGLASTGLHSNGYTLARKIVQAKGLDLASPFPGGAYGPRSVGSVLLEPTRIYVKPILELRDTLEVHGLANITGGGLKNVPRVNPNVQYVLTDPMPVPPVFAALQKWGAVSDEEMHQTFNMGMGFAVIVPPSRAKEALRILKAERPKVVGEVRKGRNLVHEPLGLEYASKTG